MRLSELRKIDVGNMSEDELLAEFRAGNLDLLALYLIKCFTAKFKKLASACRELNLNVEEVMHLAYMHITESNMSVIRTYDREKYCKSIEKYKPGKTVKNPLRSYIAFVTERHIRKLNMQQGGKVGGGEGRKYSIGISENNPQKRVYVVKKLESSDLADSNEGYKPLVSDFDYASIDYREAIRKLPCKEQIIVNYRDEGYTFEEIGRLLNEKKNKIYSLYNVCCEKIKIFLNS